MKLKDLRRGDKFRFEGDEKVFTVENVTSRRFQYGNPKDTIALSKVNPPDTLEREIELVNEPAQNPLINERRVAFGKLAHPLMDWLRENYHPHVTIIISYDGAELLEGSIAVSALPETVDFESN